MHQCPTPIIYSAVSTNYLLQIIYVSTDINIQYYILPKAIVKQTERVTITLSLKHYVQFAKQN